MSAVQVCADSHGIGLDIVPIDAQIVINEEGITEEFNHVPIATQTWASIGAFFCGITRWIRSLWSSKPAVPLSSLPPSDE